MIKINNYLDKIKAFCDFTIEYDRSNRTYLFKDKYIDDIDCLEYEASITNLESELIDVCNDIKKPAFGSAGLSFINYCCINYLLIPPG